MATVIDMTTLRAIKMPPNFRLVRCCAVCRSSRFCLNAGFYCELYHAFEPANGLCDDWGG